MALTKTQKKNLIKEYEKKIKSSTALFIVNPKGLTPNEVAKLKKELFDLESSFNVVKNSLFKIALENTGVSIEIDKGEHAVLFANIEDFTQAAKILADFMKETEQMEFRVGFIEGNVIDTDQFKQLAELPSREVLLATVLNTMQAPITSFVQVLNGNITNFMNVVNAIKNQKEN